LGEKECRNYWGRVNYEGRGKEWAPHSACKKGKLWQVVQSSTASFFQKRGGEEEGGWNDLSIQNGRLKSLGHVKKGRNRNISFQGNRKHGLGKGIGIKKG